MTLRRLKWVALLGALAFLLILDYARRVAYPFLLHWQGKVLMSAIAFTGALFLFGALFSVLERMQGRLEHRNRELLALHTAALDIHGDLSLEIVLQKVTDQARSLVDARYGALSLVDDKDRIESFVTSGVSEEQRPPTGAFPVSQGHLYDPPTKSQLAVPVLCTGPFRGTLHMAEKAEGLDFTSEDEESLVRFATTAALAIDNAYLHKRLNALAVSEERLRIAHEMHDGLAQVLAYVNTKAQAVKEFLRAGKEEDATRHLDQLAGAAREVYADVRESIIGLRSAAVAGRTVTEALQEYAKTWEAQTGIVCRLTVAGCPQLKANTELQLQRIVQEALANVRKHANAQQATVTLEDADGRLRVTVQDDGVGFVPGELGRSEFPRFGLATMRERAETIGGAFRLHSIPGEGTRVVVELPT